MRQRHMETFFAVMTQGAVTRAAEYLGVSQPSVTATLRQAEHEIGFPLFVRKSGRLKPTAEALSLYDEVSLAHASLSKVKARCRQLRERELPRLRIAASQSLIESVLPRAIQEFVARDRRTTLSITPGSCRDVRMSLASGSNEFELALIYGGASSDSFIEAEVDEAPITCIAPASWPELSTRDALLDLKSLRDRPLIELDAKDPFGHAVEGHLQSIGMSAKVQMTTHDHLFAARMAVMGLGYALVDGLTARRVARLAAGQVQIADVPGAPVVPITAATPRNGVHNQVTRQFLDCLRASIADRKTSQ